MNDIDTQTNGSIEAPGESVKDVFAEAFPEAHNENSNEQPHVVPHPAENQSLNEAQPEQPVQETPVQNTNTDTSNDERRYQYWQSQAAKAQNELAQQKAEMNKYTPAIEYLKNNPQAMQPGAVAQQPQEANFETENTFPEAPAKPGKPRNFNRSDALEDPRSESAKYLDDVEDWQDEMENYNTLLNEYNAAKFQDKMTQLQTQQKQFMGQQQQFAAQEQQARQAAEYVMANFNATEDDAVNFVTEMSDDKSINMDNLWRLYQMNKGQPAQNVAAPPPSPAFQQTERAQQVPSPMGVMPSQNSQATQTSPEDDIMAGLVDAHKAKNPWT
tara:strand:- start:748 stop:1731 length:984 start_codon:yes stop_codon:yes gene_type:complete